MTPAGRTYALKKLRRCTSLAALKAAWSDLGKEYQRDAEVLREKERMKGKLR